MIKRQCSSPITPSLVWFPWDLAENMSGVNVVISNLQDASSAFCGMNTVTCLSHTDRKLSLYEHLLRVWSDQTDVIGFVLSGGVNSTCCCWMFPLKDAGGLHEMTKSIEPPPGAARRNETSMQVALHAGARLCLIMYYCWSLFRTVSDYVKTYNDPPHVSQENTGVVDDLSSSGVTSFGLRSQHEIRNSTVTLAE